MNAKFNRLRYILPICLAAKFVVETGQQIFRPFLPIIADGIGTGVIEFGGIMAAGSMMGLGAPLIGHLADRIGFRSVLRISLIAVGLSFIASAVFPRPWLMAVLMLIIGLGCSSFAPPLQAYISTRLPYEKRGRSMAILEFSWAFSSIFGLLVTGYLIEQFSWKVPFYLIGAAMIILSFIFILLPKRDMHVHTHTERELKKKAGPFSIRLINFFDLGENRRSAWANIVFHGLIYYAISNITIIQGVWLQEKYGVGPALIGKISFLSGFFDLGACFLVVVLVDRIGKKRSVIIGSIGSVIAYALFPFLDFELTTAVISLILVRTFFEYTLISNYPLLSEQVPENRGKVMGLSVAIGFPAGAVGNITGTALYLRSGIWGIGPLSLIAAFLDLGTVIFFKKEGEINSC